MTQQKKTQKTIFTATNVRPSRFSQRSPISRLVVTIALLSASFASVLLSGCHRGPAADVMATVNGKAILRSELERFYKNKLGNSPEPTQIQADSLRLNILHQLIEDEIMQQRAEKLKLVATDDEVEAKLTEIKAPYTQEQFDANMKQQNMNLEDLKRQIRRSLTNEKLLNKEINSKITVSDTEISDYYNQHKADFNFVEPNYRLAQIVVSTSPGPAGNLQNSKANNETEALRKIQALHNQLESGVDFGTLAANYSEDHDTSPSGGDIGLIPESDLKSKPNVYAAITTLKDGQITAVIPEVDPTSKKVGAYAIFKLIAREPAGQRQLSDPRVQQSIRQQIRDVRGQLLRYAYSEMLHNNARVVNYFADQVLNQAH